MGSSGQGWGQYYSGTHAAESDTHQYTKKLRTCPVNLPVLGQVWADVASMNIAGPVQACLLGEYYLSTKFPVLTLKFSTPPSLAASGELFLWLREDYFGVYFLSCELEATRVRKT